MSSSVGKYELAYVVDTHASIWYLTGSALLGVNAQAVFHAAEQGDTRLHISAISIAERYFANQKHLWFADFAATLNEIKHAPYFRLVPFDADDVLDFGRDRTIVEMHDRIIVGLARRLLAPLLTVDTKIAASRLAVVIW